MAAFLADLYVIIWLRLKTMEIKIKKIERFSVCGFAADAELWTGLEAAKKEARMSWDKHKDILPPFQRSTVLYGVIRHSESKGYSYLLGIRATDNMAFTATDEPEDNSVETVLIPSGEFASAKAPDAEDASNAWTGFIETVLPKAGYELDKSRNCFERYNANDNNEISCEMWAPVVMVLSPVLSALSEIDGINVRPALKRLAGKQRVLEMTAKAVGASIAGRLSSLSAQLENGSIDVFRNDIHGLKGSLAQIGAEALSEEAALLEEAAKKGDGDYCHRNFRSFAEGVNKLGNSLINIFGF